MANRHRSAKPRTVRREKVGPWSAVVYQQMARVNSNYHRLSKGARKILDRWAVNTNDRGDAVVVLCSLTQREFRWCDELNKGGWFYVTAVQHMNVHAKRGPHAETAEDLCTVLTLELTFPRGEPRERL